MLLLIVHLYSPAWNKVQNPLILGIYASYVLHKKKNNLNIFLCY